MIYEYLCAIVQFFRRLFSRSTDKKKVKVQIINKTMGPCDSYIADIIIDGVTRRHSFFPQHWTRAQVSEGILEAYDYSMERKPDPKLLPNGNYRLVGICKKGLPIELFINQDAEVVIAYPFI